MEMQACYTRLDDAVASMKALGEIAARKRHTAEVEKAKMALLAKGVDGLTNDMLRKAYVTRETADVEWEAVSAEGIANAARANVQVARSQADILRSMYASQRDNRLGN